MQILPFSFMASATKSAAYSVAVIIKRKSEVMSVRSAVAFVHIAVASGASQNIFIGASQIKRLLHLRERRHYIL